jgi:regulation of enolase protein 1 (concanavalin A-like superfamily)
VSGADPGRGFARLAHAELTKLLTVPRWCRSLAALSLLTVGFGVLTAAASHTDANDQRTFVVGPEGTAVVDDLYFVHRTVAGDATIVVRVASQEASHPAAQAGLLVKQDTTSGSRYTSLAVTPRHGVRFDADFSTDPTEAAGSAPRWLRLSRRGAEVRGYTSDDGADWRLVGTRSLAGLGPEVEVGMFVSSPDEVRIERDAAATLVGQIPTLGRATFADLSLDPAPPGPDGDGWHGDAIAGPLRASAAAASGPAGPTGPTGPSGPDQDGPGGKGAGPLAGSVTRAGGVYTITGSGDIGPDEPPDDSVQVSLFGTVFGLMALVTVAVLFVTSEDKHHLAWTTFAASPRRRRVLAAKALSLAAVTFGLGLVTAIAAYLAARPVLRSRGFGLPAFAPTSLGQPGVIRAVVGTAVLLTAFALLGLGLGSILRRSSGAIAAVFTLGIVPLFAASIVPAAGPWLLWLTPAGGFAVQRAKPPTNELAEPWSQMSPWGGLAVTCAYAVAALAVAAWTAERRDA